MSGVRRVAKRKLPSFHKRKIKVVDAYCGIGGLSHGLVLEGFNVVAGIDSDASCKTAFEANNDAIFISKDIARFTARELNELFGDATIRVLVGCAPCQPYSTLTRRKLSEKEKRERWYPLYRFMRLVRATKPEVVSMENVPDLSNTDKYPVFADFVRALKKAGYHVSYETVDASRYGVPQRRNRLVLLASKLGEIKLIPYTHDDATLVTVRDTIESLPRLKDGGVDKNDPMHRASKLSELNKRRIAATPKNGGSAKSWGPDLKPKCYRRESGRSYMVTVYGRMRWDDPAPTMTTQCTTLGTGRFGHPTQNRAISLREAARFQTFPDSYIFGDPADVGITHTARHIGNAVPVMLGRAIGRSIKRHVRPYM
ncbi:DNA cytosine methyltransferase [Bradyrhizobium sp. SZCCHNR3058]|uniref:DNA cytosine methyltransferase n=1 Tax=Bradyrhizobium sp. SZCCHNR3058 TaxID=3057423 RepID=UPI002915F7EB|nr:DNA cytosine methyltransferase [Bradyrhizobium sp. SZCCHNR3058]